MASRSRSKSARSKPKAAVSGRIRPNRVESLSNLQAVEKVIEALHERDALGKVHSATVAIARTLAARLDDPDDAKNARLWKEYREAVATLLKAGEERRSEFDQTLATLEASLRDLPVA